MHLITKPTLVSLRTPGPKLASMPIKAVRILTGGSNLTRSGACHEPQRLLLAFGEDTVARVVAAIAIVAVAAEVVSITKLLLL